MPQLRPPLNKQIETALHAHRPAILQFSRDLVAIATENPPGSHYAACVQRICHELDGLGMSHQVLDGPRKSGDGCGNILCFVGTGKHAVYFHGHYDVVPAQAPDQFTPRVENGYLVGRGSADMKAGLAAMIYAAFLLKDLRVPLAGRIGLCLVGDEETGGHGGSRYLDDKGLLGQDGIAMLTMEPTGGVVWHASRGAITLKITAKGKAAHVGLQYRGINAFEGVLKTATALQHLKREVEQRTTRYRIEPAEAAHSILMLGGRVEGGTNFNVVPESCSFTLERRFDPEEGLETERGRLIAVLEACKRDGVDLDIEVLQEGDSSAVAEDHPLTRVLAETIQHVTGAPPVFEMCPGMLENRWYTRRGVPAFALGPGLLELAHTSEERVEIERVYQHALIYALTAAHWLTSDST